MPLLETFLYIRTIEILLSIIGGCFLCWLGFRLFHLALSDKSDLKMEYGKFKFQIYSAAPGIFFSLLGAAILVTSVWRQATIEDKISLNDGGVHHINITKGDGQDLEAKIEDIFAEALLLQKRGNLQDAKKRYFMALEKLPYLGDISNNLADICLQENNLQQAMIYSKYANMVFSDVDIYQKTLIEIHQKSSEILVSE